MTWQWYDMCIHSAWTTLFTHTLSTIALGKAQCKNNNLERRRSALWQPIEHGIESLFKHILRNLHQWRRTTKSKFETLAYAPLITVAVYVHGNSSQLQTTPIKSDIGCCCFCCHVTDMKSTEAVAWRLRDSHWPYAICAPPNLLFTVLNYHVPHETGHLDPCRGYTSHVQANPYDPYWNKLGGSLLGVPNI